MQEHVRDEGETAIRRSLSTNDKERMATDVGHRSLAVYELIRQHGVEEMERPLTSLFWSGLAGGLAVSMSLYAKAFLHDGLPDAEWRNLISSLGYSVGFIIVIMGRLQLFTENTITAVLPTLAHPTWKNLGRTARLWTVVLLSNLLGCALAAGLGVIARTQPPEQVWAAIDISLAYADNSWEQNLLYGVPAGFLIACIVWMRPNARGGDFWIILMITYVIGAGHLTHVIVGATELFLLMFWGALQPLEGFVFGILPTLAGNVIGGTVLFALIAYGQIKEEIAEEPELAARQGDLPEQRPRPVLPGGFDGGR